MNTAFFRSLSPLKQLLLLILFSFISLGLFVFLGAALCRSIWGLGIEELLIGSNSLSDEGLLALKFLMAFQHVGYFILPALLFTQLASDNRSDYLLAKKRPTLRLFLLTGCITAASFYIINLLVGINQQIEIPGAFGDMLQKAHVANTAMQELLMQGVDLPHYLYSLFVLAFIPAIGEELMFRGIVMKLLARQTKNIHVGIWLTAVLFALLHMQIMHFLPIVFMGALFGYLLIWTGNIWIPILAHFLNNAATVTIGYFVQQDVISVTTETMGSQPDDWLYTLLSLLVLVVVLYFISKKSQWKSIKGSYFDTFSNQVKD